MKNVVAIIPARAGSKRVPGKNIKELSGKPLITYSIDAAKKSQHINKIVITTDDPLVKKIGLEEDVEVIDRPEHLANDTSSSEEAIVHAISELRAESYSPDIIVLLQPTSPLRNAEDIDSCIGPVLSGEVDSTQSVTKVKEHPDLMVTINTERRLSPYCKESNMIRSQEFDELYIKTGSVYACKISVLDELKGLYGKNHIAVIAPRERSIDIDEQEDFELAEFYLQKM